MSGSSTNNNATSNRRRGLAYTSAEVMSFLDLMEKHLPIGPQEWGHVETAHADSFPEGMRDAHSLRRKFNSLIKSKSPTGDPNCPPDVKKAKRIQRLMIARADATDGVAESELGFVGDEEAQDVHEGAGDEAQEEGGYRAPSPATVARIAAPPDGIIGDHVDVIPPVTRRPLRTPRQAPSTIFASSSTAATLDSLLKFFAANLLARQQEKDAAVLVAPTAADSSMMQHQQQAMMMSMMQQQQAMMNVILMKLKGDEEERPKKRCRGGNRTLFLDGELEGDDEEDESFD